MFPGRITCRRRRSLRCLVILGAVISVQIFFISSLNVVSFESRNYSPITSGNNQSILRSTTVCQEPVNLKEMKHVDVYTYDLPDITNYSFVTGKRFKEYVIPIKTEQEAAYGPNLDPVTVLLIPFSHVDPGYGKSMERYYMDQTRHTLTHLVSKLDEYRDFTFQWVETVFLERWWRDIDDETKKKVRDQVLRGQFEIALGGWVMPDEASTHYVSVIDQLLEGHQWLIEHLGVKPKNSWSNDPFGFSSTMPYLWKKSGMDNMVILRIHQAIKATLMKQKTMEFNWRPLWSRSSTNDILCHLMPYRGYWIGDTCGPYNQHICREYAFMRENPIDKVVFLTDDNLEERARILYEQYRITAEIYRRHESGGQTELILPMYLGEDFSYTNEREYDLIYKSYTRLMKFINEKKEWKMTFKFGTTDEYFSLIRNYQDKKSSADGGRFPTLAGDFFPYSDYQNDYWTGYYTTRPFNKQFSREIQSLLRMADILHFYAFALSRASRFDYSAFGDVSANLRRARRDLGMFLHHDGITGTSVMPVIDDFKTRLFSSFKIIRTSMSSSIAVIMSSGKLQTDNGITPTTQRANKDAATTLTTLSLSSSGSKLLVVNSVGRQREEVITIKTDSSAIKVLNDEDREVPTQVTRDTNGVLVSFKAFAPAFGIYSYTLKPISGAPTSLSEETKSITTIENEFIQLEFDGNTGQLSKIVDKKGHTLDTTFKTSVLAYDSGRSGAYIFAPNGPAKTILSDKPDILVRKGRVFSEVRISHKGFKISYRLNMGSGLHSRCVFIKTEIAMKQLETSMNKEVILRFESNINTGHSFYTDQNGFQLMGRKNYPDRPTEQNYYPLTSMAVVEDSVRRLTLHSGQPHGFASLESGWMEVMLDRKVSRDDDKGLGQGVTDNVLTHGEFIIQMEARERAGLPNEVKYTYPSRNAFLLNELILDPYYTVFIKDATIEDAQIFTRVFGPVKDDLPCGVSVVGLRNLIDSNLQYNGTSLILHQRSALCGFVDEDQKCSSKPLTLDTLFSGLKVKSGVETSLTHLHHVANLALTDNMTPEPNELRAFKLTV